MDINHKGKIDKDQFVSVIDSEPDLLEIFDFLNKGGKNLFTNEELEKRERDEKLSRRVIKLEKNLKKISEFLHESFPISEAFNFNTISPTFSPQNRQSKNVSPNLINMNHVPREEEKKQEILSPPVGKTTRNSILYQQVHGFEKNIEKIFTKLSPELRNKEENELDIERNFLFPHENNQRLTIESVMPEIHFMTEDNYLNKKDPGYISQKILNNDFDGDDSPESLLSGRKINNFTFNNSDLSEKKVINMIKSLSQDVYPEKSPILHHKHSANINNLIINGDASPSPRQDRVLTTAMALKEMIEITKEIREDCDKNQKNQEKTQNK